MAPSATSSVVVPGTFVWLEDEEEAWIEGEVIAVEKKKITVRANGKEMVLRMKNCHAKDTDMPSSGVDDMTKLSYLHEPGVLHNIYLRYSIDEIYTYTGSILIAVNPFRSLPHLYDVHMMDQYKGMRLGDLSPHVFAIAETAYRAMLDYNQSQSILVSGESGAGKTETTKLIMQYLAYMGGRASSDGRTIESQVLESNPLLEAFGNAKTVRNNNSSRFGKFVEIQFDRAGRISGAAVRTYLLERSRVVQISDPERNYHCFYQLCCGATEEEREQLKLGPPESFHYLNQSSCFEIPGKNTNAVEYANTRRAMEVVGLTSDEQDAIFRVVAAILHLGNITFAAGKATDSSKVSGDKSKFHLDAVAELLSCEKKKLRESLLTRTIVTPEGNIKKDLEPKAALVSRDTLAKTLYSRLFDWLVDKINKSIGQDPDAVSIIGVLDIYGFESFQVNSFEQFCINLANEKLQQHFNQHVFKAEQEEYEKEAIDWSYIEFVDNQDVLELIEKKPMGIIALLDEQCMFPKSTPETFATKLYQSLGTHERFEKPKLSSTDFTIVHYAGKVTYQTELFLDKNKDYVVAEHQDLLGCSKDPFVAALFPSPGGEKAKSKFTSLGSSFKQQLADLMSTLGTTAPHYIRCVKPNSKNKAGIFENHNVLQQLRCGGVLEAIRISCAGYPTRRTFDEFLSRFSMLAPDVALDTSDMAAGSKQLLEHLKFNGFQVGKSKVFLRAGQMADLDAMRTERLHIAVKVIQRCWRAYLLRRRFMLLRKAAVKAQAIWRGKMVRKEYQHLREERAAIVVQSRVRGFQARKKYQQQKAAAIKLQAATRGMTGRKRVREMRRNIAATKIQTAWRRHHQQQEYTALKKASITMQCAWRGRKARMELRQLKHDARQTGALQAAKSRLEKQCEELTWRLQLEKRMRSDLEETKVAEVGRLQKEVEELKEQQKKDMEELKGRAAQVEQLQGKLEEALRQVESLSAQLAAGPVGAVGTTAAAAAAAAVVAAVPDGASAPTAIAAASAGVGVSSAAAKMGSPVKHLLGSPSKGGADSMIRTGSSGSAGVPPAGSISSIKMSRAMSMMVKGVEPRRTSLDGSSTLGLGVGAGAVAGAVGTGSAAVHDLGTALELEKLKAALDVSDSRAAAMEEEVLQRDSKLKELEGSVETMREECARMEDAMQQMERENLILRQQALSSLAASGTSSPRGPSPRAAPISAASTAASTARAAASLFTIGTSAVAAAAGAGATPGAAAGAGGGAGTPATGAPPKPGEGDARRQRVLSERQQADQDAVLNFIVSDLGFDCGRPVAACVLYRALLHWRSFEAEQTNVFDRIITTMTAAIESPTPGASSPSSSAIDAVSSVSSASNFSASTPAAVDRLCYWLSNASALLLLLHRSFRSSAGPGSSLHHAHAQRRRPQPAPAPSLFSRVTQSFRAASLPADVAAAGSIDGVVQVDPKFPALLFKQQLTAFVEKLYGCIRDGLKKEIAQPIQSCIQASRSFRTGVPLRSRRAAAVDAAQNGLPPTIVAQWGAIVQKLAELLTTLKGNHVPSFLCRKIYTQVFAYINVQLFNSLLLRRECCSFSNGEFVKEGLAELELWAGEASEEFTGNALDELRFIRQAVGFLVIHQKPKKSLEDIAYDLCPALSMQQLYRISTMYRDDKYGTHSVAQAVINAMRQRSTEESSANGGTNSFLLDDDSSVPFAVDDLGKEVSNISLHGLHVPPHLRELGSFHYLFSS